MKDPLQKLSQTLNYSFNNTALLREALTHRSTRGNNYERLEFLGDSAVNFIIAEALFQLFPQAEEGELSRLRARLVKGETLAELASEFNVADYLRLGMGELKSGGAHRQSIQADVMEAIIGAIFVDGGFEVCKACVLRWYRKKLQDTDLLQNLKDPKTRLQEYLQSQKLPLPNYSILKVEGEAHNQTFSIECAVEGLSLKSFGKGKSRRKAEQDAAQQFLQQLDQDS